MMKKMKSIAALFLSLAIIGALSACGSAGSTGSAATKDSSSAAGSSANVQEVTVKASNFKYDQTEYHVKKGQPVKITLVNEQGNHGLAIKEFNVNLGNGKMSATFTPDKAGSYTLQCSVVCGSGHATMASKLVVE